jgi:hypothetical protein
MASLSAMLVFSWLAAQQPAGDASPESAEGAAASPERANEDAPVSDDAAEGPSAEPSGEREAGGAEGDSGSGTETDAAPPSEDEAPAADAPTPTPSSGEATPEAKKSAAEVPRAPDGPPFYRDAQISELRSRYGIAADPRDQPTRPIWRCLIPDPRCGFTVELVATSAYSYRMRQGEVDIEGDVFRWHSGRAAYDFWLDVPVFNEVRGKWKYTRLTLGPKGGVIVSDSHDLWGNVGLAGRYWLGRGAWAPAIEFSTALTFKLRGVRGDGEPGPVRSPVGITADLGINVGGWGAIIFGAQYDSPLAREEVPERFRQAAGGQIFVGFRGNVLWGAPAGAAVATQAATHRNVTAP